MNNDLLSLVWNYVRNESNYELIKEMSNWYVNFSRLKNTPFVRMNVLKNVRDYLSNNIKFKPKFACVYFFKIKNNGFEMHSSYEVKQIVLWLLENGIY